MHIFLRHADFTAAQVSAADTHHADSDGFRKPLFISASNQTPKERTTKKMVNITCEQSNVKTRMCKCLLLQSLPHLSVLSASSFSLQICTVGRIVLYGVFMSQDLFYSTLCTLSF
jgi:hypothetical protein